MQHKAINMSPQPPIRDAEARNWDFFLSLPEFNRDSLTHAQVKDAQLLEPLFEFSGACAGCGETPYIKLLTQLRRSAADCERDRMLLYIRWQFADLCLPKTSSGMTRGWAYGNEAADGHV